MKEIVEADSQHPGSRAADSTAWSVNPRMSETAYISSGIFAQSRHRHNLLKALARIAKLAQISQRFEGHLVNSLQSTRAHHEGVIIVT